MPEQPPFTIQVRVSHALWPGDGVFVTRVAAPIFPADLIYLVDRNDRTMELRAYDIRVWYGGQYR